MAWYLMVMLMFTTTAITTGLWTVERGFTMIHQSPHPVVFISMEYILSVKDVKQLSSRLISYLLKLLPYSS